MLKLTPYGLLGADLTEVCLEDLVVPESGIQTGPFGSQLHKEDYVESGTPIITVEHLGENRIIHEDLPMVSDEDKKRLSRFTLQEGDIVFSRVGSVDRRALVRKEEAGWLFSGRCLRVRADQAKVDPVFLSYFFGLPSFKSYVRTIAVGATMPSLNTGIMKGLPVYLPDRLDQEHIARLLTALDDKIEINRRMCGTLEEMARAVFKSWFVDFDPVRAKIAAKDEGRDPERAAMAAIAGKAEDGLDVLTQAAQQAISSIASLFSDSLVELSDVTMPTGWRLDRLGDITNVTIGRTPPRKEHHWFCDAESGVPWASIRDMGKCGVFIYETDEHLTEAAIETKRVPIIPEGTVLVSFKLTVGRVAIADRPIATNEAIAHLGRNGRSNFSPEFLYLALRTFDFDELSSTSSIATAVNSDSVRAIQLVVPSEPCRNAFEEIVQPMFALIRNLDHESRTLAAKRDALLPRLLSGEIDVGGLAHA